MNRTDTIKAHKLTALMVATLENAVFSPNAHGTGKGGGYVVLRSVHPRTRSALHARGLMYGHHYLTREGVEILAALAGNTVDVDSFVWEENKIFPAPVAEESTVTVQGEYVEAEDAFAHMAEQEAARVIADGGCVGLCAIGTGCDHCDAEYGPADAQTDTESVDTPAAQTDDSHVIIPGVNALDMGSKGYNRFVGIGESQGVPGSLYTYGLATAISAAPGMNGTGKINVPCEFGDVITVRTSLGNVRYVVEDNRYSATGPRMGDPILTPYTTDDVRCYICQTHGDNSMQGQNVDGEWVCGYCVANNRTPANLNSHKLSVYVETENAGTKYECKGNCGSISLRSFFGEFTCEREEEVSLSTVPTGTTHHSTDAGGQSWVRFAHVLSVGDVVQSTDPHARGIFKVHALIPGLPVVYVDPCDGREPFPMGATKLYAL